MTTIPKAARDVARGAAWSMLVLAPVVWQERVVSSDLMSHTYNAWLANEVERTGVPGLVVVRQYTNVLFDVVLAFLLRHFDPAVAERLAVSAAVLAFFWGAWAFVRRVRGRADVASTAILVVLAHGWVLQQGLLNFYIAVACALWFLSVAWGRGARGALRGLPFLVLGLTANPLPVLWASAVAIFLAVTRQWRPSSGWTGLVAGAVGVRILLALPVWRVGFWWRADQAIYATGAEQLLVYSAWSLVPAGLLATSWVLAAADGIRESGWGAFAGRPALLALGVTVACIVLLPAGFSLPGPDSLVTLIPQRTSLLAAVVALAAFAPRSPGSRATLMAVAASFFALLYVDHGRIMQADREVAQLVGTLPRRARVMGTASWRNTRVIHGHFVERHCVQLCWAYSNHEPASGQFRLRAVGPSPAVLSDYSSVQRVALGSYVVGTADLPLYSIENCETGANRYCLRELAVGDTVAPLRR